MWPIALLGAAIAVILALSKTARGAVVTPTATPPVQLPPREEMPELLSPPWPTKPTAEQAKYVNDVLIAARKGTATKDMITKALQIAKDWFPGKIPELQEQLARLLQGAKPAKPLPKETTISKTTISKTTGVVKSPFKQASNKEWSRFVKSMGTGKTETVSPGWHLGIFYAGARRLEDLGYMTNVRKEDYKGKKVWKGDFKAPITLQIFLSDPMLQYQMFKADMAQHYSHVLKRYKTYIGKTIAGEKVTLSGLLALAKAAGLRGAGKWLKSKEDRAKYIHTTNAFKRANGIF